MWTPEQQEQAKREGWGVFVVVDARTQAAGERVLPASFGRPFPHAAAALRHVIGQAQQGSPLHLAALRAVVAPATKTRKRRR